MRTPSLQILWHKAWLLLGAGERVWPCSFCDKVFMALQTLTRTRFGSTVAMCLTAMIVARSLKPSTVWINTKKWCVASLTTQDEFCNIFKPGMCQSEEGRKSMLLAIILPLHFGIIVTYSLYWMLWVDEFHWRMETDILAESGIEVLKYCCQN